jgi:hypothetical protein
LLLLGTRRSRFHRRTTDLANEQSNGFFDAHGR